MDAPSNWRDVFIAFIQTAPWLVIVYVIYILREPLRQMFNRIGEAVSRIIEFKYRGISVVMESSEATPPSPEPSLSLERLLPEARKILGTLWFHQRKHFSDDRSKVWTFAVVPNAPGFRTYLEGVTQLVSRGLVYIEPSKHHCALTPQGWEYCREHEDELPKDTKIYRWG